MNEVTGLLPSNTQRRLRRFAFPNTMWATTTTPVVIFLIVGFILLLHRHHVPITTSTTLGIIAMAQFELVEDLGVTEFVELAEQLHGFLHQHGAIRRSLVLRDDRYWTDLVYWKSLPAALKAAEDIEFSSTAKLFLRSINKTTLESSHANVALNDWDILNQSGIASTVVEIAKFHLIPRINANDFIARARATTPFFHTAGRGANDRILAQGYEDASYQWVDIIYWSSQDEAETAARAIEKDPAARPFLDAIDESDHDFSFTYSRVEILQDFLYR